MTSRKYDGRLRDEYEAFLCAEDQERLVVYAPVGAMSYDRRQQAWVAAPDGLLEIYFKLVLKGRLTIRLRDRQVVLERR